MRARFEKVSLDPTRSFHIEERQLASFDAPWHFHPEIELTLILQSRGHRFVGDSIEPFAEGDLILLGSNLPHFWHNERPLARRVKAHSIVAQFRPDFLGAEVFQKPEFHSVKRLFGSAARGLQFPALTTEQVVSRLQKLVNLQGMPAMLELLAVLQQLAESPQTRLLASAAYEPSLDHHTEQRLSRVYDFLVRNFRDRPSLAQIARIASMTPEAFSRYFKRETGRNVSVFLKELRIDCAGRMLRETDHNVGRIALESGFPTLSSFNRRFREKHNCTPRDFRRTYAPTITSPPTFLSATKIIDDSPRGV